MVGFGFNTAAVSARSPSATFEELATPLFDSLYNFAHWLTQNREEAEDLVQEAYAKALKGFGSFEPGMELSRLDFPYSAQYVPNFAQWAGGNPDCVARRRGRPTGSRCPQDAGIHPARAS